MEAPTSPDVQSSPDGKGKPRMARALTTPLPSEDKPAPSPSAHIRQKSVKPPGNAISASFMASFYDGTAFHHAVTLLDDSHFIFVPSVLSIICKLMKNANSELRQLIFQDMLFLLHNKDNYGQMLDSFGWQGWLLDILFLERSLRLRISDSLPFSSIPEVLQEGLATTPDLSEKDIQYRLGNSDTVLEMNLKLFSNLLLHAFRSRPRGWCFYADMLAMLVMIGQQHNVEIHPV